MSTTITITGNESVLRSDFIPPLILDDNYECGLLHFYTFNSIPNINENNNVFVYGNKEIRIPYGTYDLFDLHDYLESKINDCTIIIRPNNNTFRCSLFCSEQINFGVNNSLGPLLGFSKTKLESNKWYESEFPVSIIPVSVIRIECDLVQNSYTDGLPTHIIHEFVPNVPPGHQLIEVPTNIIYFPIKQKLISSITVRILDLKGKLINFRNENIQLCLHLQKLK